MTSVLFLKMQTSHTITDSQVSRNCLEEITKMSGHIITQSLQRKDHNLQEYILPDLNCAQFSCAMSDY